jgi:hypothetical protein
MQLSHDRPLTCPVMDKVAYVHYTKEVYRVRAMILSTYKKMQKESDEWNEKYRLPYRFYPIRSQQIIALLDQDCFTIKPFGRQGKEHKKEWLEVILNRVILEED